MKEGRGFTLVEMAVVMVLIAIAMSLAMGALRAQFDQAAIDATVKKQETIRQALITYLGRFRRLPCPDGVASAGAFNGLGDDERTTPNDPTTPCSVSPGVTTASGLVPYRDLGLTRDTAIDGWGNLMSYHVSVDQPNGRDWTLTANFNSGNQGAINFRERFPADSGTLTDVAVTTNGGGAVFALVSHGKNGLGAYTVKGTRNTLPAGGSDEAENTDGNADLVRREYSESDVAGFGAFDDVLLVATPSTVLARMIQDGAVKAPGAELQSTFSSVQDTILGQLIANNPNLPSAPAMPKDPWGTALTYTRYATQITSTTPSGDAYRLLSAGGDRQFGTADDVTQYVFVDALRAQLARNGLLH